MSGIAGIFQRDGAFVEPADLECMRQTLAHRGPDRSAVWNEASVGLVHCMLWTTPESLLDRQPSVNQRGTSWITADARIDNREELIATLGIGRTDEAITDSSLIMAAYDKWGEACPDKLIGDFAFVIWDSKRQAIFSARDPMGVKCLYYFCSSQIFAFASEIKGLTCLKNIPQTLNELRVADFLVNFFEDREITFYKDVKRLPAASTLAVSATQLQVKTYWSLDPNREIRLGSDAAYAEAFRDLFSQAVRSRTRSAFPVASTLSGGLDSSAVACMAQRCLAGQGGKTLHTLSAIFPSVPEADLRLIDERSFMQAALGTGNFEPHFIRADQISPMTDIEAIHYHLDEANFAPNLYLHWAMYKEARQNGVRVVLDGFDGDTTVSHGFTRFVDLLLALEWKTLSEELTLLRQNLLPFASQRRVFVNKCLKPLTPAWAFQIRRLLQGRFKEARGNETLLEPALERRYGIRRRVKEAEGHRRPAWLRNTRSNHLDGLSDAAYSSALEIADKTAAAFGLEARYPFFDRRLIEFCLALPADQKFARGWNRIVLRRAMEGILPPEIQWRPNKGNLSSNFQRRLLEADRTTLEHVILRDPNVLSKFVSVHLMRAAYAQFQQEPVRRQKEAVLLFGAVNLGLWLRSAGIEV